MCFWNRAWHLGRLNLSPSPRLLNQPHVLYGICCPLWIFLKWTLTFGTSQSPRLLTPGLHLEKNRFFNYCHYFFPSTVPDAAETAKSFLPPRGNVTFSAPLSQVKNKEWRLRVAESNWDVSTMPWGGRWRSCWVKCCHRSTRHILVISQIDYFSGELSANANISSFTVTGGN